MNLITAFPMAMNASTNTESALAAQSKRLRKKILSKKLSIANQFSSAIML